ncbi:Tic 40 protein [Thalictrum thalictroides]|uniref:Tic 40 protein n=1 Tax=Thalictrum thalictroides TaxID=46969 RepID=A0A7J6VWT5_THATH|nr:Tic 40 protein [Thalictrum thalictroides]
MQQAFKTMMGPMSSEKSPFSNPGFNNAAFSPQSPFPFPTPQTSTTSTSPSPVASKTQVDVPATKVEATRLTEVNSKTEIEEEPKRYAFVDVSPEEILEKDPFKSSEELKETKPTANAQNTEEVSQNGAAAKGDAQVYNEQTNSKKAGSVLSVEALEKMMEDPTVQNMVFPYLPEEMRDPTTFKWMLQNPQYRQQLEDMLKICRRRRDIERKKGLIR